MAKICLCDLSKPNLYRAIEKMFAGYENSKPHIADLHARTANITVTILSLESLIGFDFSNSCTAFLQYII